MSDGSGARRRSATIPSSLMETAARPVNGDVQQLVEALRDNFATAEDIRKLQDQLAQAFLLIEESQQGARANEHQLQAIEQRLRKLETKIDDVGGTVSELRREALEPAGAPAEVLHKPGDELTSLREKLATLDQQWKQEHVVLEEVLSLLDMLQQRISELPTNLGQVEMLCSRVPEMEAKLNELLEIERDHLNELRTLAQPQSFDDLPDPG